MWETSNELSNEVLKLRKELEETKFQLEIAKRELENTKRDKELLEQHYSKFHVSLTNEEMDILIKGLRKIDREYLNDIHRVSKYATSTKVLEDVMTKARVTRDLENRLQEVKRNRKEANYVG